MDPLPKKLYPQQELFRTNYTSAKFQIFIIEAVEFLCQSYAQTSEQFVTREKKKTHKCIVPPICSFSKSLCYFFYSVQDIKRQQQH